MSHSLNALIKRSDGRTRSSGHVQTFNKAINMTGHFEGKSVLDHLKEARARGAFASAEIHGTEAPGHISAGADSAKETCLVLLLLWILFHPTSPFLFILFSIAWFLWKIGRSALLGWARLERLHRLIQEEKWEIEHNREEEKQELTALYKTKGLSGKLLEDVISVFMADDNRLLRIMLEEEMGLTLQIFEHPLKQSSGAALGVLFSSALFIGAFLLSPFYGPILISLFTIGLSSYIAAKQDRSRTLEAIIWNLSCAALACGVLYFLTKLIPVL